VRAVFSRQEALKIFVPFALIGSHTATQQDLANLRDTTLFPFRYRLELFLQFVIDPQPEKWLVLRNPISGASRERAWITASCTIGLRVREGPSLLSFFGYGNCHMTAWNRNYAAKSPQPGTPNRQH
jgi:hypothetical protein